MLTAGHSSLFSLRSPAATPSHRDHLHLHPTTGPILTCKLKHLGLGHNNMTGRAFCSLLDCLHRNTALTSMDLSHNELQHTSQVRESLRQFLRMNKGLRTFDLSHNRLTADSVKGIHLGLLENDVLLLLPLVGNGAAKRACEFSLVQVTPPSPTPTHRNILPRRSRLALVYIPPDTPLCDLNLRDQNPSNC